MDIILRYTLVVSFVIHILMLKFAFLPGQKDIILIDLIEVVRMPAISEVEEEEAAVTPIKEIVKEKPGKKPPKKPEEKKETKKAAKPMSAKSLIKSKYLLETAKFPYKYYIRQVRSIIDSNWDYSKAAGSSRTMVYFRILPDGSVIKLKVKESSGNKIFDFLAKRAVELSKLPPLPQGYKEKYLGVYIEFVYRE